jgi:hypothetical protein
MFVEESFEFHAMGFREVQEFIGATFTGAFPLFPHDARGDVPEVLAIRQGEGELGVGLLAAHALALCEEDAFLRQIPGLIGEEVVAIGFPNGHFEQGNTVRIPAFQHEQSFSLAWRNYH